MKQQRYKNIIVTNHAAERMRTRSISIDRVHQTVQSPDTKCTAGATKTKFIRKLDQRTYHVVAQHKPDQHAWLVISAWVRGENDKPPIELQLLLLPFRLIWAVLKLIGRLLKFFAKNARNI